MFRFVSEDRDYINYTANSRTTNDIITKDLIDPVNNKLFNFDIFDKNKDNSITIRNSPTRRGTIAGVLLLEGNRTYGKVSRKFLYKCVPDDCRLPIFLVGYKIKTQFEKANKNRYVIIKYRDWDSKHPKGYIDQNLGPVTDLPSFYQYQLYCRSLNSSIQTFTKSVKCELKKKSEMEMVDDIIAKYNVTDRRHISHIISIDPTSSKDFDDAFGIQSISGGYILSIYIANVPLWLDFLGLWDSFSKRVSTIYLPDRKLPMMPTILSDILCSLQEGRSRFALSLDIHLNSVYEITKYELINTVIKLEANLRYDTARMHNNATYKQVSKIVKHMQKNNKYLDSIKSCHDMIAYLMITMNHYCAKYMFENKIGIYRSMTYGVNDLPSELKDKNILNFLKGWHGSGGKYTDFNTMVKHDALDLDKYLHITSPIRRLVDLINIIEIQPTVGITNFTDRAKEFHYSWTTTENLSFINNTMRSIRKVQNECTLLYLCTNTPEILSKRHKGFVFDKMVRTDGMFQYQVYLSELKMVRKTVNSQNIDPNNYYDFGLYLFMDQDRLYQKVRISLM